MIGNIVGDIALLIKSARYKGIVPEIITRDRVLNAIPDKESVSAKDWASSVAYPYKSSVTVEGATRAILIQQERNSLACVVFV